MWCKMFERQSDPKLEAEDIKVRKEMDTVLMKDNPAVSPLEVGIAKQLSIDNLTLAVRYVEQKKDLLNQTMTNIFDETKRILNLSNMQVAERKLNALVDKLSINSGYVPSPEDYSVDDKEKLIKLQQIGEQYLMVIRQHYRTYKVLSILNSYIDDQPKQSRMGFTACNIL